MTRPLLSKPHEVPTLLAGRMDVISRPMKVQPSAGVRHSPFVKSGLEDGHGRELKLLWQPGDVLWLKEAWAYKYADKTGFLYKSLDEPELGRWRSSVHMPPEAARIWLRLLSVKAVCCQDVTEEEALREGVEPLWLIPEVGNGGTMTYKDYIKPNAAVWSAKDSLESLHTLRYGAESWEANTWLWKAEVERIDKPENLNG